MIACGACREIRLPDLAAKRIEVGRGDIRDADTVAEACCGVDVVFHVAALPGVWGDPGKYHDINFVGTKNVLAGCQTHGISKLIYTSSPSVVYDGRPHTGANESLDYAVSYLCAYPQTKALAEQAVLAANGVGGLNTVALRPHLIFGPRDPHLLPRVVQRAAAGKLRRVGDGSNHVSVSYVENVAEAHIQACVELSPVSPCAGRAYFINEPQPVNLWEFINDVLQRAGAPAVAGSISASAAWRIGSALETVYRLLKLRSEPPMTRFMASQLSTPHWYDVSAAVRDFGYDPQVSIEEGLERTAPDLRRWASEAP